MLYSEKVPLSVFKQKGDYTVKITKDGEEGKPAKKAKIIFKYEYRNNQEPPRKSTVKDFNK